MTRWALPLVFLALPSLAVAQPRPQPRNPHAQPVAAPQTAQQAGAAERERLLARARLEVQAGRFGDALPLLRAALALSPTPNLRYMVAFAALRAGDLPGARSDALSCRAALTTSTEAGATESLQGCEEVLSRLREGAGVEPTPPTTATPPTPLPTTTTTAPPVRVAVVPPVQPPTSREALGAGPITPAPPSEPSPSRAGPVALLVGGGVLLVAGGIFFGVRESLLAPCTVSGDTATCPTPEALADAESAPGWTTAGVVSLGLGAAAAIGGVVWYIAQGPRRSRESRVAFGPGSLRVSF
ncbi:MAG: hypothetical protein JNK72_24895 [Myxococcales bacterium]|nr:hypothetical protein [Myxococcales bacterium]